MSAVRTKVFGMDLGIDPKFIALALIVVAGTIYYFTSNSNSAGSNSAPPAVTMPLAVRPGGGPSFAGRTAAGRRSNALHNDRGPLKLVAVDGSRGDVDPTLRLRLLDRLKDVSPASASRNLFEAGSAATAENLPPVPKNAPKMIPKPEQPPGDVGSIAVKPPPVSIPLKYYGFAKPTAQPLEGNRGFFMDGDNILVGAEGDMLEKRFLIVALSPNSARLEDTQVRQGQDLPVTPEAPPSQ